jgi:hypothetical protein
MGIKLNITQFATPMFLRIFFEDRRIVRICHLKLQWVRVYYFNEFPTQS